MKYTITETGDYKAVHITLPNGYRAYVNNLHPHYDSVVEVLQDETINNNDVVYMLLICNFVGLEADIDDLNYAIQLQKIKEIEENEAKEAALKLEREAPKNVFVSEDELIEIVKKLSATGEALGFDYTPQSDFENEEDFPYVRQAVFPALVLDGILLAFDSEGNGVSYYVAGISNISYVGMNSETFLEASDNTEKRSFSGWIKKIFTRRKNEN